jgi:hypothetical protein
LEKDKSTLRNQRFRVASWSFAPQQAAKEKNGKVICQREKCLSALVNEGADSSGSQVHVAVVSFIHANDFAA